MDFREYWNIQTGEIYDIDGRNMRAIILAGGKGTRLAPYTTVLPKPLMPIGDKSILEIVIRQLVSHGFKEITMAVGYHAELIIAYCGDGSKFGANISYSKEEKPMGTAGPLSLIDGLDETFLVMNGDILTDIKLSDMLKLHRLRKATATMAVYEKTVDIDLGVLELDSDKWISNYIEKPKYKYNVSTGIYMFEPSICKYLSRGRKIDLPTLILEMLKRGDKVAAFHLRGYWLDIGRHEDYEIANSEFKTSPEKFIPVFK